MSFIYQKFIHKLFLKVIDKSGGDQILSCIILGQACFVNS